MYPAKKNIYVSEIKQRVKEDLYTCKINFSHDVFLGLVLNDDITGYREGKIM